MPLFFFDLHETGGVTPDPDGRECADLADAEAWGMRIAQGVMSADIVTGARSLSCQIKVSDADRRPAFAIACSFAIETVDV